MTCIVTANDIQAIGVLRLLSSSGRDVPGDVSVIGFDDIALASLVTPSLTTVRLSTRVLGATAFEVLIARIREPETPIRRECVDVTLVERESLRAL